MGLGFFMLGDVSPEVVIWGAIIKMVKLRQVKMQLQVLQVVSHVRSIFIPPDMLNSLW